MNSLQLTATQEAAFWAKVDKSGDCWEWTAGRVNGYGKFGVKTPAGKWGARAAYRIAYCLLRGEIPKGHVLDHLCHNKGCVNPAHLRATTPKRNNENRVGANKNGKSGVRGVCWDKQRSKWVVQVGHAKRIYRGGFFTSLADAEASAIALRERLHSELPKVEKVAA